MNPPRSCPNIYTRARASDTPPQIAARGQVGDGAICRLEAAYKKNCPHCAHRSLLLSQGAHTNANEQRVPERRACCAICTVVGPRRPRGHQLSRKCCCSFFRTFSLFPQCVKPVNVHEVDLSRAPLSSSIDTSDVLRFAEVRSETEI